MFEHGLVSTVFSISPYYAAILALHESGDRAIIVFEWIISWPRQERPISFKGEKWHYVQLVLREIMPNLLCWTILMLKLFWV